MIPFTRNHNHNHNHMPTYNYGEKEAEQGSNFYAAPGTYIVQCVQCTEGISKSGNPMFTLDLWVVKALDPKNAAHEKVSIRHFVTLSDKGRWFVERNLVAFGHPFRPGGAIEIETSTFQNRYAVVTFQDEDYKDSKTGSTKTVSRVDVGSMRALTPEEEASVTTGAGADGIPF